MSEENNTENPPPLFETVNIKRDEEDDEEDDMFQSAVQEIKSPIDDSNGYDNIEEFPRLKVSSPASSAEDEMENVFISPPTNIINSAIMEEVTTDRPNNISITVTEPQKIGERMSSYMAYKIITKTNMPIFTKNEFSVMRRFSDFLGLHDKLTEKYLRSGRIIPPAPEKSVIGTTKVKMSNQPTDGTAVTPSAAANLEFVEKRRASLERYLNRTAQHPLLCIDPDFRQFIESDSELPRAKSTSALSGAGVLRLFNKVGETVNKMTYKMDETDTWFEERVGMVEALDAALRRLHEAAESLASSRKELGHAVGGAARSAAALSGAEEHAALARALSQLADVQEKVETLHIEQSNTDFYILCELLKDYIGLLGAIKDVFHERVKVFQNWQHAQMQLTKRRENKAKAELAARTDKVEQASAEIIEWEAKVDRGQQEFNNISSMIKKEMELFEVSRVREFRQTIIKYLENHMAHQAQLIKYWEAFIPEAKAIA